MHVLLAVRWLSSMFEIASLINVPWKHDETLSIRDDREPIPVLSFREEWNEN